MGRFRRTAHGAGLVLRKTLWAASCSLILAAPAWAQILIGQTAGFTGPVSAGVKETTDGAKLYFDAVNARGGIDGQMIELRSRDDGFDPARAGANARQLAKDGAIALFLTRGTPHTEAVLPVLQQYQIPLVGPSTGAMLLHRPVNRYVFNVRASYQREAEKAIAHLQTLGTSRIALVRVDDSFGADAAEGAMRGFAKAGLKPTVDATINRNKPDFGSVVKDMVAGNVQAVLIVASAQAVLDGLKALRAAGSAAQVLTLSNNASSGFVDALGTLGAGVVVSQVFPSERSMQYPMVQEAQRLARVAGVTALSPAMLEGFAAAKVLSEGLRRAGSKPTVKSLRDALESMRRYDLGGLEVGYSADDHTGLDFADLSIIGSDGKFRR